MLTVADVIFPAFYAPYVAQLFFPVAAFFGLASEFVFYHWWAKENRLGRLALLVIIANVASSAVGMIIASYLPSGYAHAYQPGRRWYSPEWIQLAVLAWVLAFIISVLIEWPILVLFRSFVKIPRKFVAALFANAISYVVLLIALFGSAQAARL